MCQMKFESGYCLSMNPMELLLIKELKIYNPEGFGDLDLNNPVRVIRSLERCIQSGKSLLGDLQKTL